MNLTIYTIFDSASNAHMRPFFMMSDGQAIRAFNDLVMDADHEVGKHPEDYSLIRIGMFNDSTGKLSDEVSEVLTTGIKAVAEARQVNRTQLEELQRDIEARDRALAQHHNANEVHNDA